MTRTFSLVFVVLAFSLGAALADEFCDGFSRGYASGFKRAAGSTIDPIPPICPFAPPKSLDDPVSDFDRGQKLGLEKGLQDGFKK